MLVSVDVRPTRDANRINPNSTKNINVAIFSVNGFDATTVDPNTVRFGATGTEAAPIHVALERCRMETDTATWFCVFKFQDTGIKCGNTSAVTYRTDFEGRVVHWFKSNQNSTVQETEGVTQLAKWSVGVSECWVKRIDPSFHNSTVPFRCSFQRFELLERVERFEPFWDYESGSDLAISSRWSAITCIPRTLVGF